MTKKQNLSLENSDNSQSNSQKTNLEKFPETLEEQRDYYLKLYEKWAKWQRESPEKLPVGFRTKEEFNFEETANKIKKENYLFDSYIWNSFFETAKNDDVITYIYVFLDLTLSREIIEIIEVEITKPVMIFSHSDYAFEKWICFDECYGEKLHLINKDRYEADMEIVFCDFDNITFENFDRAYFTPRTNRYINEIEKEEGHLTLINCTWGGLPVVRENLEIKEENINNKNSVKFDFTKYIQAEYRDIFADFFMGLKSFVQYVRGIEMSIKISVNGQLLVEIEAEESELENITRSFQEYVVNILPIINDQKPEVTSTLSDSRAAFIFLQNKVNSLEIQSQIRNNELIYPGEKEKFFVEIIQKLQEEKHFLQLENYQLKNNNAELLIKVDKLNTEIQKLQIQKMDQKDEIMIKLLLSNLGQLRLALDSKDSTLIKSSANNLKTFWQENQWKITLALNTTKLMISNKDQILAFVQYIITESLKKF